MIKHLNIILWALTIFVVISIFVIDARADDVQWSKGFDINCTNATTREDGSSLAASEIAAIKYYGFAAGDQATPDHVYTFDGECQSVHIDTKEMPTGIKDFYATTVDTDGQESSSLSASKVTHKIMKARPKASEPF